MPIKAVCAMVSIVVCYGIYMSTTPGDGLLFGSMMLGLGALGGLSAHQLKVISNDRADRV